MSSARRSTPTANRRMRPTGSSCCKRSRPKRRSTGRTSKSSSRSPKRLATSVCGPWARRAGKKRARPLHVFLVLRTPFHERSLEQGNARDAEQQEGHEERSGEREDAGWRRERERKESPPHHGVAEVVGVTRPRPKSAV